MRYVSRLAITLILCGTWIATAAGQATVPASKPASASSTRPADEPAVYVNGKPIMESELDDVLSRGARMTAEQLAQLRQQAKAQLPMIVNQLVDFELMVQAADREGIVLSQKEWDEQAQKTFEEILQNYGLTREAAATQIKTSLKKDVPEFIADMAHSLRYKAFILQEKVLKKKFADEIAVKDEEVKEYYDKRLQTQFTWKEDMVKASHILVGIKDPKTQQPISEEAKKEKRKKAEEILAEVRKPGADFAALAKQYSDDPGSKVKGGDLGWFNRTAMVQPFAEAAFALQPGEMSGIVETIHGYHIIKVTGQGTAGPMPFDEAKGQIKETLEKQKTMSVVTKYREELRKDAKIVYPPGKEPASAPAFRPPTTRPTGPRSTGARPSVTRPAGSIRVGQPSTTPPAK